MSGRCRRKLALLFRIATSVLGCLLASTAFAQWNGAGTLNSPRTNGTITALSSGKVLIFGGASPTDSAELFDPATGQYTLKPKIRDARRSGTATLLRDGTVLIAGGANGSIILPYAEIYDPVADTFTDTATLNFARSFATATLLLDGRVLVAGGFDGANSLASAEVYDPVNRTFSLTGSMNTARYAATATLLPDGRVLLAGGHITGSFSISTPSVEIYDPSTGAFTLTTALLGGREQATATLLRTGQILFAGGFSAGLFGSTVLASAELYDPVAATSTATASLKTARFAATATLLPDGFVLIAGGSINFSGATTATAESFGPGFNTFFSAGSLATARTDATAVLLPGGRVLVTGGNSGGAALASAEIYDGSQGSFTPTGDMAIGRPEPQAVLLPNGTVLMTGVNDSFTKLVERYDPATGTFGDQGSLLISRTIPTATLLANGKVLYTGGIQSTGSQAAIIELFDPAANFSTNAGSLSSGRIYHSAVLLPDGRVLIAGGCQPALFPAAVTTAEIYDPVAETVTLTGSLNFARAFASVALLPNGKVLFAGGFNNNSNVNSAEIYDPASGTFSLTGTPVHPRWRATTTLLPNGRVLIAGGESNAILQASAELYDPVSGTFSATGSMVSTREDGFAVLMPDGRVLVGAGNNTTGQLDLAELYNPANGTFSATQPLVSRRADPSATLLANGKVLVAGGTVNSGTPLSSAELYDPGIAFQTSLPQPMIQFASLSEPAQPLVLQLQGSGFRASTQELAGAIAGSEGSSGGSANAATNFPLVQLERVDNQQQFFAQPSTLPVFFWTDTDFFASLNGLPFGLYRATVFVNAIPSNAHLFTLAQPSSLFVANGNPQSTAVATAFAFPLQVSVTDSSGNPIRGVTVSFAAPSSGPSATLSAPTAITDSNGFASVTAMANTLTGTYIVSATIAGGNAPANFLLTNNAGAPAQMAVLTGSNQSSPILVEFLWLLEVQVTDQFGNPVVTQVDFSAPSSGATATLSETSVITSANTGEAFVSAWANAIAGTYLVTATVDSPPGLQVGFVLTNVPGPAALLVAQDGPDFSGTAGLPLTSLPMVMVTDVHGNPVGGIEVDFATSGDSGSLEGQSTTSDANGIVSLAGWTLSANAGTNTVLATSPAFGGAPLAFTAEGAQVTDVAVTLTTNGKAFAQYGHAIDYVIVVTASGPSNANGVLVSDQLSPLLDTANASWVCVPATAASCDSGGSGAPNDAHADISTGSSVTFVVSANVIGGPSGELIANTASATSDGDTDLTNNSMSLDVQAVIFRNSFEAGGDGAN